MKTYKIIVREFLNDRLAVIGFGIVVILLLTAFFAPFLVTDRNAIYEITPEKKLVPPNWEHYFGTDHMGRDIFSRVIYGTRVTIAIAIIAVGLHLESASRLGLLRDIMKTG